MRALLRPCGLKGDRVMHGPWRQNSHSGEVVEGCSTSLKFEGFSEGFSVLVAVASSCRLGKIRTGLGSSTDSSSSSTLGIVKRFLAETQDKIKCKM